MVESIHQMIARRCQKSVIVDRSDDSVTEKRKTRKQSEHFSFLIGFMLCYEIMICDQMPVSRCNSFYQS